MKRDKFTGLMAAPHSPFDSKGDLNLSAVETQAAVLLEGGVSGAFVGGTTGEGHSLSREERRALIARWAEVARGTPLKVMAHVGHNSLGEAKDLARGAQEAGVDAISAVSPNYYRPSAVQPLFAFLADVAGAAPAVPFYLYDIPGMTRVDVSALEFMELASEGMPSFAGVKYSNPDLATLQLCLRFSNGAFDVLFGSDETLLAGWALGVRGAVGSTYNFAPQIYHRILEAFDRGDWETARLWQARSVEMVRTIQRFGWTGAAKAVMSFVGVDCGPPRLPVAALAPAQRVELRAALEAIGFFDWRRPPSASA